jgi:hypothetical protein
MRQGKITLYLLIACLLIAGTGFFLRQHARTVKQNAERKDRVFDGFSADQVKRIEILGAEREFEFARGGDGWLIQKPLLLRADRGEVDNLLSVVELLERKRKITPEELSESKVTLADYGLEKPRLTLKLFGDQKKHQIDVGHENRQSDGVYVRIDKGPSVSLVAKSLAQKLEQPLDQWRNRSVLGLADAKVARVEIKTPKRVVELARQGDTWRVVQPLNARASSHAVESLIDGVTGLRAEKFLSDESGDLKKYHLDEPHCEITVKTDKTGDAGQTLVVGAPAGGELWSAVCKGSSSIVAIPAKFVAMLDADLKDLRDSQLLHLDRRDVEDVEIRQGDRLIRIEKAEAGWKITGAKPVAADRDMVEQFLSRFAGMQIHEFTTDVLTEAEKFGLGARAASVRLFGKSVEKGKEAPVLADVRIGDRNPKKPLRYVKRVDESSVYGVGEEDARFIPSSALDLRDRVFLTISKDAVREVRLKTARKEIIANRGEKGDWVSDATIDRAVLNKIVADVSKLMAIRLVSENEEANDSKFGFNRPMGELTVTEKNGDETVAHELLIGAKTDGKVHVLYRNKRLVAEIPIVIGEELTTSFIKR